MTVGEVTVLGSIALIALTAWLSLALAHAGTHNALVAAGVPLLTLGGGGLWWWRRGARPVVDVIELAVLGVVLIGALVMFYPGSQYAIGDKDPGVYVAHAFSIERTGSHAYYDPTLRPDLPINEQYRGARFPGVWVDDEATGRIVPQFFHLLPAVFATALGLFGPAALFSFNGVAATMALLALVLAIRRAFGWGGALIAGALLVTNMIEVWHARYPTTEILTQMFVVGALLAAVASLQTGKRLLAALGGTLVGLTFLARPDGFLAVLLAVAVLCTLAGLGRADGRCAAFAAGLAAVLPHAFLQTYLLARRYALANGIPDLPAMTAAIAALLVGALVLRSLRGSWRERVRQGILLERAQHRIGRVLAVAAAVGIILALLRPVLLGQDWGMFNGRPIRTYDEENLRRLTWFITAPGLAAAWFGFAVVAMRRWRAAAWLLLIPGAFIPIYLWHARVSSRLMWSTRRLVPFALVTFVILIAAGLSWALARRRPPALRLAAAATLVFVLWTQAGMSLPLRSHREFGGSYELGREIAAMAAPGSGVFLWQEPESIWDLGYFLGGPMALLHGQNSAVLPPDPTEADLDAYARTFPGDPIFVVSPEPSLPESLRSPRLIPVRRFQRDLPFWEESDTHRPDHPTSLSLDFMIWRLQGK